MATGRVTTAEGRHAINTVFALFKSIWVADKFTYSSEVDEALRDTHSPRTPPVRRSWATSAAVSITISRTRAIPLPSSSLALPWSGAGTPPLCGKGRNEILKYTIYKYTIPDVVHYCCMYSFPLQRHVCHKATELYIFGQWRHIVKVYMCY